MITPSETTAVVIVLIGSVTDIRSRRIPNWLTFPGALVGIFCQWYQTGMSGIRAGIEGWFLAVAIMFGTLLVAYFLKRSGSNAPVGFGDIKLMAALGACLGTSMFVCQLILFSIFFLSFSLGFTLLKTAICKSRLLQTLKTRVALAPFMAAATICSIVFYRQIGAMVGLTG